MWRIVSICLGGAYVLLSSFHETLYYLFIGGISIGKELNHRGDWYFGVLNDNEDLITVRSVMDQKRNGGKPCPANCNGQGQCQDGVCQCYPQYSGLDCSQSKYRVSHIMT